jgi:hypothetical protein
MPSVRTKQAVQESETPDSCQEQAILALALNMQDGDKPLKTPPGSPLRVTTTPSVVSLLRRAYSALRGDPRSAADARCAAGDVVWAVCLFGWLSWAPPGEVVVAPRGFRVRAGLGVVVSCLLRVYSPVVAQVPIPSASSPLMTNDA